MSECIWALCDNRSLLYTFDAFMEILRCNHTRPTEEGANVIERYSIFAGNYSDPACKVVWERGCHSYVYLDYLTRTEGSGFLEVTTEDFILGDVINGKLAEPSVNALRESILEKVNHAKRALTKEV